MSVDIDKPYRMFSKQVGSKCWDHYIVDRNYRLVYYRADITRWVKIKRVDSYEIPPIGASVKYLSEEELFLELL